MKTATTHRSKEVNVELIEESSRWLVYYLPRGQEVSTKAEYDDLNDALNCVRNE